MINENEIKNATANRIAEGIDGELYIVETPVKTEVAQKDVHNTKSNDMVNIIIDGVIVDRCPSNEAYERTRAAALNWDWD
jgi:uncharacterized membrane protein YcaP (DUF421 family)